MEHSPLSQMSTNGTDPHDAIDWRARQLADLQATLAAGHSEASVDRFVELLLERLVDEGTLAVAFEPPYLEYARTVRQLAPHLYHRITMQLRTVRGLYVPGWEKMVETLPHTGTDGKLVLTPLSDVEPEPITYLWEPYLPLGKLTILQGDPGQGKSWLMLAVAAALTRGYSLPDSTGQVPPPTGQPANVIYLSAEDGMGDTLRPRAEAAGADLTRLYILEGVRLEDGTIQPWTCAQMPRMAEAIIDKQAVLVILDPLQAFLGSEVDINRTNEVRPILAQLHRLAQAQRCSILAIRHLTKAPGVKASYRGQGSIDFTAAARSVLFAGTSPDDDYKRVVAQDKHQYGHNGASLVYGISDTGFAWYGTMEITADELAQAQPRKQQRQRKNAMEWLKDYLKSGPVSANAILAAAQAVGISDKTLRRAKESLGILSQKQGPHDWFWRLPTFQPWDRDDDMPF